MKRFYRVSALLCLLLMVAGCGAEDISEMALELYAYVVIDGEIVYEKLQPGIVYDSALEALLLGDTIISDATYTGGVYGDPVTIVTNGTARICSPDGGMIFGYGGAPTAEHVYLNWPEDPGVDFTLRGEGIVNVGIRYTDEEREGLLHPWDMPVGVGRTFVIEVYDTPKLEAEGAPRVVMTVRYTYKGFGKFENKPRYHPDTLRDGYSIEILSIEHMPPTYW